MDKAHQLIWKIMDNDRRLIEETFPIKEIGELASKDKYLSNGHIQTLHPWWARRPLPASRSTIYAALIENPKNNRELNNQIEFILKLSKWENSTNLTIIDQARKNIRRNINSPKILDPFLMIFVFNIFLYFSFMCVIISLLSDVLYP